MCVAIRVSTFCLCAAKAAGSVAEDGAAVCAMPRPDAAVRTSAKKAFCVFDMIDFRWMNADARRYRDNGCRWLAADKLCACSPWTVQVYGRPAGPMSIRENTDTIRRRV